MTLVGAAGPAAALVPAAPVALPTSIEVMPPYQPQTYCDPHAKPGIVAFAKVLTATYPGTAIVSEARPCGSDTSEHYDGRALDWGVDYRNDRQRAQGKAFLHWLFATDASGNRDAMLRRLGIMYVIWDKQIWGAWSQQWEPYSCSGVTACHVDHMHLSFDWSGAMKRTSFWTGVVRAPMAPPLLKLRAMHSTGSMSVPLHQDSPVAEFKAVAGGRYRLTVTGTYNVDGRRHHRADAMCATTDGLTWTPTDGNVVVAKIQHWRAQSPTASGCSSTHTYTRTVSFTVGTALAALINDPQRWAGSGAVRLTAERVG